MGLTYMSINEEIWSRIEEGRLIELRPYLDSDPKLRSMYLDAELHREIYSDRDDDKEIERFAKLQADLDMFLTSERIDPKHLFGLTPITDGVWEIRSTRPKPSIRVFGLFSNKDTFIATHYIERIGLGGWNSNEWKTEIRRALAIWRQLFPAYDCLNSDDIDSLITGSINEQYFK